MDQRADWFVGGGEMGALMRSTDWSKTRLGPVEAWPKSLRTMLGVVLGSRFPMLLWWGPDLLHLYNDAYRPILRDKHPASLAAPAAEVWAEIWDVAGPMARGVLGGGPATWVEDLQLFIHSEGMAEETYFTFSYSPVPGDDGRVGGILNTVQETTAKVQSERQIRLLHELSARALEVNSEADAHRTALEVLSTSELDLPFAFLYTLAEGEGAATLVGACGWPGYEGPAKPLRASVRESAPVASWPFEEAIRTGREVVVEDLAGRFGSLPSGHWGGHPERAMVMPLSRGREVAPSAFLVLGVSPHRKLDERYRRFFRATADQVVAVIAQARAFEAEKKRAELLADVDRTKTAFFSNVSHEFRTPLTLMLGPTEDALASPEQALTGEPLKMVRRNTLRLMKLVNTLLDFSRIEAGRAEAAYEPSDLAAMTQYLAASFRSAIERTGLRFDVDCAPLPELIYVDHDMWEKIVLNLLSNALKFTFEGAIGVSLRWSGEHAELTVRDTGIGIAEKELPHLFERFHRVVGAVARTHEGSGIGLALVNELVRLQGGTVRVVSEVGKGTAFTVSLPRGAAHLPEERVVLKGTVADTTVRAEAFVQEAKRWTPGADKVRPEPEGAERLSEVRILVVDDNADLRDYVVSLLQGRYTVETAVDGLVALEAARIHPPALVLTDVMMPRLDGFGLLREMRADPLLRSVPVILLSARAGEEATIEGLEAGADDYLIKPFAARELLARVRTHVELALQRTEAKRTQEALARAKDAADLANKELEHFSYAVAHDLRAPLRSIDGFSLALLQDYAAQLDDGGKQYLNFVRDSTRHMANLIDDLLALSLITRDSLERQAVDLSALATASVVRLQRADPGRKVETLIQPGLLGEGDPRLLGVVFDNLLGNAWKFTMKADAPRIEFGAEQEGDRVVYFIRDNGAGFDMEFASRLFGVFQRLHSAAEFPGTGVGLATVQRVIHRHSGQIWADSQVGHGATFHFTLSFHPGGSP